MVVGDCVVDVGAIRVKVCALWAWVAPKLVPAIVTAVAAGPVVGERLVMVGGTVTVNEMPLLAHPPTVTTTLPVVAPAGPGTTMPVADQVSSAARRPGEGGRSRWPPSP